MSGTPSRERKRPVKKSDHNNSSLILANQFHPIPFFDSEILNLKFEIRPSAPYDFFKSFQTPIMRIVRFCRHNKFTFHRRNHIGVIVRLSADSRGNLNLSYAMCLKNGTIFNPHSSAVSYLSDMSELSDICHCEAVARQPRQSQPLNRPV